jgi:general secretion pathway protein K
MNRLRSLRGSVLIIVLVTLLFTAFALLLFVEQASTDLLVEAREASARRLRQEAYSALEVTLATLEDFRQANGALHNPAEGWGDPLGWAAWTPREGCTAEVTLEDESGKLSLSNVDAGTMTNLFEAWALKQPDAERLTDALMGWMRQNYVPATGQAPDYEQSALPYLPPARALRSFSELAAIDYAREVFYDEQGRPNDLWRRFAATFSLYNYQQSNLNAATPDILTAIGFSDLSQQQRLRDFLAGTGPYASQGPSWFSTAQQASTVLGSSALPPLAGIQVRALRVNVTIREGREEFRLSAVVAPQGGATIVQTTATSTRSATSGTTTTVTSTATPASTATSAASSTSTTATPPPQLNYPFTLLEIEENPAIPTPPPAVPPA